MIGDHECRLAWLPRCQNFWPPLSPADHSRLWPPRWFNGWPPLTVPRTVRHVWRHPIVRLHPEPRRVPESLNEETAAARTACTSHWNRQHRARPLTTNVATTFGSTTTSAFGRRDE